MPGMKYAIALVIALSLNATANLMIKFGMERFKAAEVQADPAYSP